jgi:hypothetical protein
MSKPRRGYWYKFYESYCVLCADSEIEKVRIYNRPKPKHWHERHIITEVACDAHFM